MEQEEGGSMKTSIQTKPRPHCPVCAAWMILRKPKEKDEWSPFWSCPRYFDGCKGRRQIDEDGKPEFDEVLERGAQVVCIPSHLKGQPNHKNCEAGFVTSVGNDERSVFVRYWRSDLSDLRTKANSELTYITDLVVRESVPQERVEAALKEWCE